MLTTATPPIVGDLRLNRPIPGDQKPPLRILEDDEITIVWGADETAKLFDVTMVVNYEEFDPNNPNSFNDPNNQHGFYDPNNPNNINNAEAVNENSARNKNNASTDNEDTKQKKKQKVLENLLVEIAKNRESESFDKFPKRKKPAVTLKNKKFNNNTKLKKRDDIAEMLKSLGYGNDS